MASRKGAQRKAVTHLEVHPWIDAHKLRALRSLGHRHRVLQRRVHQLRSPLRPRRTAPLLPKAALQLARRSGHCAVVGQWRRCAGGSGGRVSGVFVVVVIVVVTAATSRTRIVSVILRGGGERGHDAAQQRARGRVAAAVQEEGERTDFRGVEHVDSANGAHLPRKHRGECRAIMCERARQADQCLRGAPFQRTRASGAQSRCVWR